MCHVVYKSLKLSVSAKHVKIHNPVAVSGISHFVFVLSDFRSAFSFLSRLSNVLLGECSWVLNKQICKAGILEHHKLYLSLFLLETIFLSFH